MFALRQSLTTWTSSISDVFPIDSTSQRWFLTCFTASKWFLSNIVSIFLIGIGISIRYFLFAITRKREITKIYKSCLVHDCFLMFFILVINAFDIVDSIQLIRCLKLSWWNTIYDWLDEYYSLYAQVDHVLLTINIKWNVWLSTISNALITRLKNIRKQAWTRYPCRFCSFPLSSWLQTRNLRF